MAISFAQSQQVRRVYAGVAKGGGGGAQGATPPPLIGEYKKKEKGKSRGLVYATTHILPLIMTFNVQEMPI